MNPPTVIPGTPHNPDEWFRHGQLLELAWEADAAATLTPAGVRVFRDELHRRAAIVAKCVDICQGELQDQHMRDLRALLVRLGYMEDQRPG